MGRVRTAPMRDAEGADRAALQVDEVEPRQSGRAGKVRNPDNIPAPHRCARPFQLALGDRDQLGIIGGIGRCNQRQGRFGNGWRLRRRDQTESLIELLIQRAILRGFGQGAAR